jgi:predicted DCC family thiol-disulfide oxidoreductase YuxK
MGVRSGVDMGVQVSMRNRLYQLVSERLDPRPLAIMRILVGLAAIGKLGLLSAILPRLYRRGVIRAPYVAWLSEPPQPLLTLLVVAGLTAAVCFTVGLRTRWAGAVLTAVLGICLALDQQLWGNHLYLLFLWSLLLTIADSGGAFALDSRGKEPRPIPAWPAFLIKVQLSIVYGFTAVAKVNAAYLSGAVFRSGFWWAAPRAFFSALAVASILVEGFLAIGLWVPRLRPVAFIVGLGLHTGILLAMKLQPAGTPAGTPELLIFGVISLAPYVLFLDAPPASRLVVWDDRCAFCRTCVRWFQRLDWLDTHRFIGSSQADAYVYTGIRPGDADEALQLVGPAGRTSGFAAVRSILEVLPISFLLAPVLRLPPVDRLGRKAWRAVATRHQGIPGSRLPPGPPAASF